jgi:hypothetical protein
MAKSEYLGFAEETSKPEVPSKAVPPASEPAQKDLVPTSGAENASDKSK